MRSIAISCAALLASVSAGCSFIDDFDKFKAGTALPGGDGGEPNPPDLDADVPTDDPDAEVTKDGGRHRDAATDRDGSGPERDAGADAGPADAGPAAPRCGDGTVDSARGEQCDDGNMVAGDGCEPVTCQRTPPAVCGGKSCDDSNVCTIDLCDSRLGCESRA
ncbi:MAG: hypothetical protein JWN04_1829, partial [Myxococcaceae bacterium]|nr:hypothetical protein [Myxococcaceae bacterium]